MKLVDKYNVLRQYEKRLSAWSVFLVTHKLWPCVVNKVPAISLIIRTKGYSER